jgi:hypothetical protein
MILARLRAASGRKVRVASRFGLLWFPDVQEQGGQLGLRQAGWVIEAEKRLVDVVFGDHGNHRCTRMDTEHTGLPAYAAGAAVTESGSTSWSLSCLLTLRTAKPITRPSGVRRSRISSLISSSVAGASSNRTSRKSPSRSY